MSSIIKSSKKKLLLAFTCFFSLANILAAVKTWTGLAGDGNCATPQNWSGGNVPAPTDDVILDNYFAMGDYIITLPVYAITVKSIAISPSLNHSIRLILPSTNLSAPALPATGPGYGLTINNGGIFQNSSGLSSGSSLNITDSIKLIMEADTFITPAPCMHQILFRYYQKRREQKPASLN